MPIIVGDDTDSLWLPALQEGINKKVRGYQLKPSVTNFWKLTGNAGTVDGVNFIGTTDDRPLNFRVNNVKAGRIQRVGENVYLGYEAGLNATSSANVAIGYRA
ncbi:MAG: hypothetical protein IPJ81_16030 [Chitinophagaceae bacterium]|nr:hypothetical protein [Chitinophagaceae bacterium]